VPGPEHEVRVVANVVSPLKVRYDRSRISVIPAYCTAMGQAMLAFQPERVVERYIAHCGFAPLTDRTITDPEVFRARLSEIRRRGWAINLEERFLGAVGIAVPILEPGGSVLAALNIGTVTARFERRRDDIVAALQDGAAYIAEQMDAGESRAGERAEGRAPAPAATIGDSGGA
jgi:IclR family pca regulon transcriptional regulator